MIGASILYLRHPQTCLVLYFFHVLFPATCSAEAIKSVTLLSFRRALDHSIFVSSGPPPSGTIFWCPEVHNVYDRKKQRFHREVGSRVITSSSRRHCLEADPPFVGETTRLSKHQRIPSLSPRCTHQRPVIDWVIGDSISGGWDGDCG